MSILYLLIILHFGNGKAIDDNPGFVQSGQYVWPAAEFAANFLIEKWCDLKSRTVLELGAGY
jgi:hypothetical protein